MHGKDTSKPREIHIGGRRPAEEIHTNRKMISKTFTIIQRSEPHVRDVDGSRLWTSASSTPSSPAHSGWNRRDWDRMECVSRLAAYGRAAQGDSSRPLANPEFFKNMTEIPDCRRNRQERRQTSMLLLSRASSEKQDTTRSRSS